MARVKRGVVANRRHKKVLKEAKGYYGARSRVYRVAKQAVTKRVSMLIAIAEQRSVYLDHFGLHVSMPKLARVGLVTVN